MKLRRELLAENYAWIITTVHNECHSITCTDDEDGKG